MLALVVVELVAALRGAGCSTARLVPARLRAIGAPLGFLAVLAGWTTTEVGRQPWTVYGLLRTADSVSPSLTGRDVAGLAARLHALVYLLMFPTGVALMARIVRGGPERRRQATDRAGRERPVERCPSTVAAAAARRKPP